MTGKIVNLRRARKAKARNDKRDATARKTGDAASLHKRRTAQETTRHEGKKLDRDD